MTLTIGQILMLDILTALLSVFLLGPLRVKKIKKRVSDNLKDNILYYQEIADKYSYIHPTFFLRRGNDEMLHPFVVSVMDMYRREKLFIHDGKLILEPGFEGTYDETTGRLFVNYFRGTVQADGRIVFDMQEMSSMLQNGHVVQELRKAILDTIAAPFVNNNIVDIDKSDRKELKEYALSVREHDLYYYFNIMSGHADLTYLDILTVLYNNTFTLERKERQGDVYDFCRALNKLVVVPLSYTPV